MISTLIAGVQKSGTSSLFSYMSEHPRLLPPATKELHFFDDEAMNWAAPDYAAFHAQFAVAGPEKIAFEATPIYIFWPQALERIHTYNPHMRLILLFRDPIERAWSHWCMEYARGNETLPFADAIRHGRRRMDVPDQDGFPQRVFSYVERGLYAQQVRHLLDLFPSQQILSLRSNDLADDPAGTLTRIAEFLEIEPFALTTEKRANPRKCLPYPSQLTVQDIRYLRRIFRPDVDAFAALTGLCVDTWLTYRSAAEDVARPEPPIAALSAVPLNEGEVVSGDRGTIRELDGLNVQAVG